MTDTRGGKGLSGASASCQKIKKWGETRECHEMPKAASKCRKRGDGRGRHELPLAAKKGGNEGRGGAVENCRKLPENDRKYGGIEHPYPHIPELH